MTLVLFTLVTLFTGIQGNPVPDFLDDCPGGSGDCPPGPPPPTGHPLPPLSCGDRPSSGARIVGGQETVKNSIPWQAMLRTDRAQFCGGSLVHKQWVLTAAHCVQGSSPNSFKIWLGAHRKETQEDTTQERAVAQVVIHPGYNSGTNANDIAMVKLKQEAVLGKGVGLICLGDSALHLPIDDLNNQCLISGWGTLESGGQQPDTLQEVLVPLVSKNRCEGAYGSLHDSMLCAGFDQGGKDSCQGDSGGPLACQYNGKYYIEGATSWGSGCAGANAYGVYAKVRELRSWIDGIIQG
ncbi:CUB and peptidase domain-containing protein 2-like [Orbicella faveolata]|uniref:CUB and peptidase domain-containing protein 2-like n=1 Tax=Orbicella faveolata TaxID=48498 RepID=UPI0009E3EEC8|nr:CUB and peptidase domain-containing protein 2-like [Orbicella faveolata]XP_020616216.1 CUB and peptidase domain-containing protein 2-like [Orbicella faveolata]